MRNGRNSHISWQALLSILSMAAVLLMLLPSCHPVRQAKAKGTIVVSIEPLRFFTQQIAGHRLQVISIVPPGYSPEDYKPTPQQLIALSDSKAYLKVGNLGFENTWLHKIADNAPNLPIYDTSDSLTNLDNGIKKAAFDPHTWTSPNTAEMVCRSICHALCRIDTAGTPLYQHNLMQLIARIRGVDTKIHDILSNVPSRTFIIVHPALTYFSQHYGLTQVSIEKDGKEPTPSELLNLIRRCRQDSVRVIFVQKEFNQDNARILARETGARIVIINPLDYHWDRETIHIAKALLHGK